MKDAERMFPKGTEAIIKLRNERDALQSRLDAADKERDELAKSCQRLISAIKTHQLCGLPEIKTVDDVVKGLASVADKMESIVLRADRDTLRTENAELKQRCAKLKETLIHSNYPRCSSCGASTASDEPHAADCHVTAALTPGSGADFGTREQNMKVIRDALMDGHPNSEGFLEWCDAQTDAKVAEIAADCGTKEGEAR